MYCMNIALVENNTANVSELSQTAAVPVDAADCRRSLSSDGQSSASGNRHGHTNYKLRIKGRTKITKKII
jgi:hypothetical protein